MRALIALGLAALPQVAAAQNALVLEASAPYGTTGLTDALAAHGVPYDVVDGTAFASASLTPYTMVFVASCQSDAVISAWNARSSDVDLWVQGGGFAGVHADNDNCLPATGTLDAQPPGDLATWVSLGTASGVLTGATHPLVRGLGGSPTGTPLAGVGFSSTGGLFDVSLVDDGFGNALQFLRNRGLGWVVVGGLAYEYGWANGQDAGISLDNEIGWAKLVGGCGSLGPDVDADTVPDVCDRCPGSDDFANSDRDAYPDACDICPGFDDDIDVDGNGIPDGCDCASGDDDLDGVCNDADVCAGHDDLNDADGDGVPTGCDVCEGFDDNTQPDTDGDGVLDGCDICSGGDDAVDTDSDGLPDDCDNCPADPSSSQTDTDADGVGDRCDACPGFDDAGVDTDGDTVVDDCDQCAGSDDRDDQDDDGIPDDCDLCPGDVDVDLDGVCDSVDVCIPGDDSLDSDSDGVPDACDRCPIGDDSLDADSDFTPDDCDNCPAVPNIFQQDDDGDGWGNNCDQCPFGDDALDADGDTRPDACDLCPGADDLVDTDFDFWPDGCDNCPNTVDPSQADSDLDGRGDVCDVCPLGPDDQDADQDGVADACDICAGADDFLDTDDDGVPDGCDNCPDQSNSDQVDADSDTYGDACDCGADNDQVYPGAPELCDGIDNDCNGVGDDDALYYWPDTDRDGFGDAGFEGVTSCEVRDGWVDNASDCDDFDDSTYPGAKEVCGDGIDNDCDSLDDICAEESEGCGCNTGTSPVMPAGWLVMLVALSRRRARG